MAQISTEQALQIPQQLKRQSSQSGSDRQTVATPVKEATKSGKAISDDSVTIRLEQSEQTLKKISVSDFKQSLGQDNAYVKETLKNKLSEFNLNPNTPLSLGRDMFGNLEIKGPLLQGDIEQIRQDLEKSPEFMNAFHRLSQHQPTLDYVDNVVKLSKAYGVSNALFNSIVSEDQQFNGLTDIAHRYQAMKTTNEIPLEDNLSEGHFKLTVN